MVVPVLPPAYSTVMVGGMPYYYANDIYYSATPGGYLVTEPPPATYFSKAVCTAGGHISPL